MKKIILIVACLTSLTGLSGCSWQTVKDSFVMATASFTNPVGNTQLAQAYATYGILQSGAVAYRDSCEQKLIARSKCAPIVIKLQTADRNVQASLDKAVAFVKAHPTIDAKDVVGAVMDNISVFQSIATKNGVI